MEYVDKLFYINRTFPFNDRPIKQGWGAFPGAAKAETMQTAWLIINISQIETIYRLAHALRKPLNITFFRYMKQITSFVSISVSSLIGMMRRASCPLFISQPLVLLPKHMLFGKMRRMAVQISQGSVME